MIRYANFVSSLVNPILTTRSNSKMPMYRSVSPVSATLTNLYLRIIKQLQNEVVSPESLPAVLIAQIFIILTITYLTCACRRVFWNLLSLECQMVFIYAELKTEWGQIREVQRAMTPIVGKLHIVRSLGGYDKRM